MTRGSIHADDHGALVRSHCFCPRTQAVAAVSAEAARARQRCRRQAPGRLGSDPADSWSDVDDGADRLLAQDPAGRHLRHVALETMQVGAQIVTASTEMTASREPLIFGSATSVHDRSTGPPYTIAFIVHSHHPAIGS